MTEVIITPEMREDAKKCGIKSCDKCKMLKQFHWDARCCIHALASSPGVWDEAYANDVLAQVVYTNDKSGTHYSNGYTRTLPKSLKEEIAEKYAKEIDTEPMIVKLVQNKLVEMLKEYAERKGQ